MARTPLKSPLRVDSLTHDEATRRNAPTAELEAFVPADVKRPIVAAYERRNPDLDPQLVWRGKDVADWSDLVVEAPPLYIQEKIHPKALIEDLKRTTARKAEPEAAPDLFADFNGIAPDQKTEFYAHDQHWSNRMILGDGLKVMASLAEREGLKGQVQCIYIDPPYGIKFNSNFQWSTTSRDVKDGKAEHFSREPEQVKAFRDTWADGIHSYLTYLRDRLTVARDLLTESGSVFVQIGDENVHRVRALMDEVFGDENVVAQIAVKKTSGATSEYLPGTVDYILFFAKDRQKLKFRQSYTDRKVGEDGDATYTFFDDTDGRRTRLRASEISALTGELAKRVFRLQTMTSQSVGRSRRRGRI
jgi:adenine-specific DNA-methyltransferase